MDIPLNSPIVASLLSPNRVFGSTVTYGFLDEGERVPSDFANGRDISSLRWSESQKNFIRDLFDYLPTVVDLSFNELPFADFATIGFVSVDDIGGTTLGYSLPYNFGDSLIVLESFEVDFETTTAIHEIGHSLGLSHPFDGPSNLPGVVTDADPGDFGLNTELATRMAYSFASYEAAPGLDILGLSETLGAIDIAVLQSMYGAPTDTALGNTTYGISNNVITIWDNGGSDLIDFSDANTNAVVDLRPATLQLDAGGGGYFSYIELEDALGSYALGGYTIAFGVEIENGAGGSGNDRVIGNDLDNMLQGNGGDDVVFGGAGRDTAIYTGNQSSYTLRLDAQATTIEDRRGNGDGRDALAEVEALMFGDAALAPFDLTKFAGTQNLTAAQMESFVELYIAYFNRAPDAVGLNFWGTAFATGTTLGEMAALFTDQDETRATYPTGQSNAEFATAVYGNVLGRAADADGFDFWVGVLDSGASSRDQFILSVLDGAKTAPAGASEDFLIQQAADRQYLSIKTDIGAYFSVTKGLSDVADAAAVMAIFDGSAGSISDARTVIDGLYASALDADNGAFLMPLVGVLDDPFAV